MLTWLCLSHSETFQAPKSLPSPGTAQGPGHPHPIPSSVPAIPRAPPALSSPRPRPAPVPPLPPQPRLRDWAGGGGGAAPAGGGAMLGKDYMLAIVLVNCDGQRGGHGHGHSPRGQGRGAGPGMSCGAGVGLGDRG